MSTLNRPATEQEKFWAGRFGDDYSNRNRGAGLLASNLAFFSKALNRTREVASFLEIGANIGMNLKALNLLFPSASHDAIEINPAACQELRNMIGDGRTHQCSILDFETRQQWDVVLSKGVLIHVSPEHLTEAYIRIARWSRRYVLFGEYYSRQATEVPYRGHADKLYKRDFAGEFLDACPEFALVDYGFCYHRDPNFPQDDINWFLFSRKPAE